MRQSRRRSMLAALAFAAAVFVAIPTSLSPVHADDGPIVIDFMSIEPGSTIPITFSPVGEMQVQGIQPNAGCFPIGDGGASTLCIGSPLAGGDEPLIVSGSPTGPLADYGAVRQALGWIVEEAIESVRVMYGVPLDYRIRTHAAAEIRAYVQNRIIDILDRYAYGVPLTPDEQRAFDFVEQAFLETDRAVTRAAYEEYQRWQAEGCLYAPPAAPAFVTSPVGMPTDVTRWCTRAHNFYDTIFVFAPPQPTAEHFQAWGAYRNAAKLGLSGLGEAEAQQLLADTIAAGVVLGGVATAIGAAVATSAIVGSSATLAAAMAGAMGASATLPAAVTAFGPTLVSSMIGATGAAAAASVVAVVVVAVVVTAIAIWQVIEYEKVGQTLLERMNAAAANTDPFGLEPLRAQWAGLELRSQLDPAELPAYRGQQTSARLAELVTRWLTTSPSGALIPDGTGVWADNATTIRDHRFEVDDGDGPVVVDEVTLPGIDGDITVRFNRSWLIVTPAGGEPTATLSFAYLDPSDRPTFATRSVSPQGGWVLTSANDNSTGLAGVRRDALEFENADGELVSVRIVPPQKALGGPRPTVVGPLVPDRVVNLRPNPVSEDGSFDLERYRTDYSYSWQVARYDSQTATWQPVDVSNADEYGAQFVPTAVGEYRALVTMSDLVDPSAPDATGVVQFRVTPPPIQVEELELLDDGVDALRVALRFSQPVPSDQLEVTVRWPGEFGSDEPIESVVELECHPDGPTCSTVRSELFAELRTALSHTIGPRTDLAQGVMVTVANSHGGVHVARFEIDHPERPSFAAPPHGPGPEQLGTVVFSTGAAAVQLAAEVPGDPNYVLATVRPGESDLPQTAFGFYDPDTHQAPQAITLLGNDVLQLSVFEDPVSGEWRIGLWGNPTFDDVGIHEIPLILQQNTGARTPFLLRLEIVATPDELYRGALVHTIDPSDFTVDTVPVLQPQVIGGRVDWAEFAGTMCVALVDRADPSTLAERCGPVADFFDDEGAPLPFPYRELLPAGIPTGNYEASAWIVDASSNDPATVFSEPHRTSFVLTSGAPRITDLRWNTAAGTATLALQPFSASAPITAVTCELDGAVVPCWSPTGGTWNPGALALGEHDLHVWVADAAGNHTSHELAFTVAPPGEEPEPDPVPGDPGSTGTPKPITRPPGVSTGGGAGTAPTPTPTEVPPAVEDDGDPDGDEQPRPTAAPGVDDADDPATVDAADGVGPVLIWVLVALVVAATAVGVIVFAVRRRAP